MMLRVSLAAALMFGGSITAALAAPETAPAEDPAQVATPAAAEVALPRFQPSEAEFATPTLEAVEVSAVAPAVVPEGEEAEDLGSGMASWYGAQFAGRKTASGERFDPTGYTAAHRTLPFGSKVKVSRGGKSVVVRINDRGPFSRGRVIDLSQAAASELGLVSAGHGQVSLSLLD